MKEPLKGPPMTWAQFRFSVIGGLLARPPEKGELQNSIKSLAEKLYRHPIKDAWVSFSFSLDRAMVLPSLGRFRPHQGIGSQGSVGLGTNHCYEPTIDQGTIKTV